MQKIKKVSIFVDVQNIYYTTKQEFNLNFEYKNLLNFGVSYRNFDAVSALFHLNILDHVNLYYAYDITTSNIQKMGSNTHEFIISYRNCPNRVKGPSSCPLFY